VWGIEDAMFCFHAGAVSWLSALAPWGSRVSTHAVPIIAFRRLLVVTIGATAVLSLLFIMGVKVLSAFLIVHTLSTAIIIAMRPSFIWFAASGVPVFATYYFLLLSLWRLLMPGFMDMWTGSQLTGYIFWGVPIEEYVWVASFCAGFTITMAFALDARFTKQPA
jgi:hypothetical protein